MIVGFNHNFRYKDKIYHVQTEDGGLKNPNIVTLLYLGGTILASLKTSYADIIKVDNLDQVVEELMKEQHTTMVRNLKAGDYDAAIARSVSTGPGTTSPSAEPPSIRSDDLKLNVPVEISTPPEPDCTGVATVTPDSTETPVLTPKPTGTEIGQPSEQRPKTVVNSLDEIILSYLMGDSDE